MGMLSQLQNSRSGGTGTYQSGGTSSYPVTGFPATAYRGNNRRAGGGKQGQPSSMSGLSNVAQYSQQHVLITLGVLIGLGYLVWHLDNRKK
jgi:hypothetical protein